MSERASRASATFCNYVFVCIYMVLLVEENTLLFETLTKDTTWDHELIFQEVASAINQDMLAQEEGEPEEIDPNR